jgi:colanic acid biosynthesis glycosyl transferase WcaI
MTRLIFLNRYFYPDHSATSQILSDLAFRMAAAGKEVHVITSKQLYDNPIARLSSEQQIHGVKIHRVATTNFGRSNLIGRATDYFSFYASTWRAMQTLVAKDDILIAKTDPPLISVPAMLAARRRGAKLVNWLQDIYPEVAVQLDVPFVKGPFNKGAAFLRDLSLKSAVANVVVGQIMADRVVARGISPDHVHVIPNWCDDDEIRPLPRNDNPLRREWGLEDKFVFGYSGNLGRAHEFSTVLAAAERLRNDPRIVFLMIGGGHQLDQLAKIVRDRDLDRIFRFFTYQERDLLKYSLCLPDAHWISLKPELEGLIVPSKFLGIAAAGRPIIAITAKDGEIARLVQKFECGLAIEPGQTDALVEALLRLSCDTELTAAMGRRAREMLDANFTRQKAFERWQSVFEAIAKLAETIP